MPSLTTTGTAKAVQSAQPLSPEELRKVHAYWRAANYLSVGQIYLFANPLLREPLQLQHIKPRLLGHWGTTPGLNFIYVHLNRLIKKHDLDVIYIAGPGHGGPGLAANTYQHKLEKSVLPGGGALWIEKQENQRCFIRLHDRFLKPCGPRSMMPFTSHWLGFKAAIRFPYQHNSYSRRLNAEHSSDAEKKPFRPVDSQTIGLPA